MAIRRVSTASIKTGSKSNKFWDQDTAQGAMEPIVTVRPAGTSNSITISNIPQTYQDLYIVVNARAARAASLENINIGIPNQTFIYSATRLIGNGSTATSVRGTNDQYFCYMGVIPAASAGSGIFGSAIFHILNYRASTNKTILSKTSADINGSGETHIGAGLFRFTSAITELFIASEFTNITGDITLYGIKAGA